MQNTEAVGQWWSVKTWVENNFWKFCKIHRKASVSESLLSQICRLNLYSLVKYKVWHLSVFCEYCKIFKNTFYIEDSRNMGNT